MILPNQVAPVRHALHVALQAQQPQGQADADATARRRPPSTSVAPLPLSISIPPPVDALLSGLGEVGFLIQLTSGKCGDAVILAATSSVFGVLAYHPVSRNDVGCMHAVLGPIPFIRLPSPSHSH